MKVLAGIAAALALAIACLAAGSTAGGQPATSGASKKCTKTVVDGRRACLRVGDRCKRRLQEEYVFAGLSCRRGKLRRASIAELRGEQPLLLTKSGKLPLKTALAAFDETIAPMPGVRAKKGEIGDVTDATMIVEEIGLNFNRLTPAQQRVYTAATTPAPDAVVVDPNALRPPGAAERAGTPAENAAARANLEAALRVYRNHGYFPTKRITITLLEGQGTQPKALGYVGLGDVPPGTSATCDIFITRMGRSLGAVDKQFVIAHEAAHCIQHAFYTNQTQAKSVPSWVKEGTAEWLGASVTKELGVGAPTQVDWTAWLKEPKQDLFGRSYDAIGFFSMLGQANVDPWVRIKSVISAAATGGSTAAFTAAIAGAPEIFHMRWGPGLLRDKALGPEWDYDGPFIDPSRPTTVTIGNGQQRSILIEPRSSAGGKLNLTADVIIIKADRDIRGLLRFEGEQRRLKKGAYCAKRGGCKCRTATNLQLPKIGVTTAVGFSDPTKARNVVIEGERLKDYCDKPRPGPASGTCSAGSSAKAPSSCPQPAEGIMILQGAENPQVVASFTIGDCTAGGGGFTAIATDGAWRLEVGLQGFSGFGREYDIPYGGPDPEVIIDGPGGPYANTTWAPPGLPTAGAISFDGAGRRMGLGFIEFRNASETAAIAGAGGMTCVYPDD